MAYQLYENLLGPDDVLEKMRDFVVEHGWTVLENLTPDLNIDGEVTVTPSLVSEGVATVGNTSTGGFNGSYTSNYTGTTLSKFELKVTVGISYFDSAQVAAFRAKWRKDGGAWSTDVGVQAAGQFHITLSDGVIIQLTTIGTTNPTFVLGDTWTFTATPAHSDSGVDGKRLSIQKGDIYAHFRSANGRGIFKTHAGGTSTNPTTGVVTPTPPDSSTCYGIGLVCSTQYSATPASGYWFDQPNATKLAATQEVIGVGIPVKKDSNYRLYCNSISEPTELLIFSLELEPGYFQHLAVGMTDKVGGWIGGTIYSGSRNSVRMFPSSWAMPQIEAESNHLFGMSKYASTFLRCDIDAAPSRAHSVLWASGGANDASPAACYTGKMLAMGVTNLDCLNATWFPKVPHYGYLQSQSMTDIGRNVNTLNCISVNLPMALYVLRDPDALKNFSQVGYVPGMYAISMRNVAPGQLYEISYPLSGNLHQVFPHVHRIGAFGYDGISIKQ